MVDGIAGYWPLMVTAFKWLLVVLVVALVLFSQVARWARKRAYGPGGGLK